MRNFVALVGFLFLAAFLTGCGDDNGNSKAAVTNLTGSWSSQSAGPGALTMNLTANGAFISGTGSYTNAAGTTLPLQITGSVNRNTFNLDFQPTQTLPTIPTGVYSGTIPDANHLNGAVQFTGVPVVNVSVTRQ